MAKKLEFYDKKLRQITYPDARYYTDNEVDFYPSVSTILSACYPKSPQYLKWLMENGLAAEDIRDEAAKRGSNVHRVCDLLNTEGNEVDAENPITGQFDFTFDETVMIGRYTEFLILHNPEVIASEQSIISKNIGIGGTLDSLMRIQGLGVGVLDIKTSKAIHPQHTTQVCTYYKMVREKAEEQGAPVPDFAGILHLNATTKTLGKKGKIQGEGWKLEVYSPEICEHEFGIFQHAHAMYKHQNPYPKPKHFVLPSVFSRSGEHAKRLIEMRKKYFYKDEDSE